MCKAYDKRADSVFTWNSEYIESVLEVRESEEQDYRGPLTSNWALEIQNIV